MSACLHRRNRCLNEFELIRKYRCEACGAVMMCACDETVGRKFLAHQLNHGVELDTQREVPVTAGFKPSPYISHYLCIIWHSCATVCLLFLGTEARCIKRRARRWNFCGLQGSEEVRGSRWAEGDAAWMTRRDDACQAGEARAFAAATRRLAASPQAWAAGQPEAIATLMRRTLTRTRAPILSSLRRMVPQVALAKCV
jgi:hypothetical protein